MTDEAARAYFRNHYASTAPWMHKSGADKISKERWRELKNGVPNDVRDLTGRMMGDPLPGRSALDQKRLAEPLPVIEIAEPIE